jgi:acyl dehydratase
MNKTPELDNLVGTELGVSEWIHITQEMVNQFADVTRDPQWIHLDVEKAKVLMPETGTIVHGYFTLSLLAIMMKEAMALPEPFLLRIHSIINYGINKLRFTNTVPVGSRVRARVKLERIDQQPKGVHLICGVTVEIEGKAKPALVSENIIFYILKK